MRHVMRKWFVAATSGVALTACSQQFARTPLEEFQPYQFMATHPEQAPLVPRESRTEYQVVWVRSWKPTLYLTAFRQTGRFDSFDRAFVEFNAADEHVGPLRLEEISIDSWGEIERSVEQSGFWQLPECLERAYRMGVIHFVIDGVCEDMTVTDGAQITIAASDGVRSKGILASCPNLDLCEPFGDVARAILRAVRREYWATQ